MHIQLNNHTFNFRITAIASNMPKESCKFQKVQTMIDMYERAKANLSTMKSSRLADKEKLNQNKNKIGRIIEEIKRNLIAQLDKLEEESLCELNFRHKRFEERINTDIGTIGEVLYTLERNMKVMAEYRGENGTEMFHKSLENVNSLKRKSDALWETVKNNAKSEKLEFVLCQGLKTGKLDLKSFGRFVENRIYDYTTSLQDEYEITISTDDPDLECNITGCCVMSDGAIILADSSNANLKKLNETYKVTASCNLPDPPCDVCIISDNEVAVVIPKKKIIQFVSVAHELKLGSFLTVGYNCMCVDYSKTLDRLYITYNWPMQICVLKRDGEVLQTIWGTDKDNSKQDTTSESACTDSKQKCDKSMTASKTESDNAKPIKSSLFCIPYKSRKSKPEMHSIFSVLEEIMFSLMDKRIYACDSEQGLIVLSDDGDVILIVRNFREMPQFSAKKISRGCNNDFFVYGQSETTKEFGILHIGEEKKVERISGDILKMRDLGNIEAMCFDKLTNQLIVATKGDNYIKVFSVT